MNPPLEFIQLFPISDSSPFPGPVMTPTPSSALTTKFKQKSRGAFHPNNGLVFDGCKSAESESHSEVVYMLMNLSDFRSLYPSSDYTTYNNNDIGLFLADSFSSARSSLCTIVVGCFKQCRR